MARLVPSEVVRIIDDYFQFASKPDKPDKQHARLGIKQIGRCSAIVALIDQLPQELIAVAPADYANFMASSARLRANVNAAMIRGESYTFYGESIWALRHALSQCPDSPGSNAGGNLRFIRQKALRDDLHRDLLEAQNALTEGRWKAATVLGGSIIEALLVWKLSNVPRIKLQAAVNSVIWQPAALRPTGRRTNGRCSN
jgi:hypothetical protein